MEATEERLGTKDQVLAVKHWEVSVDPAGSWWRENHVREHHAVTNHIAISQLRLICQPSEIQLSHPFFNFTPMRQNTFLLCKEHCCHKQVTKGESRMITRSELWLKVSEEDYWPMEGESGRPAVQNQLVSSPAGPAPSVSHLLAPLGSLVILSFVLSIQRLQHSYL